MTKVKICGITRLEDAQVAAAAGCDLMGFVFYPKSPRYVTPRQVQEIVTQVRRQYPVLGSRSLRPGPLFVGVFVDRDPDEVAETLAFCGLDYAQLHGSESPAAVSRLRALGHRVIKAFRVRDAASLADLERFEANAFLMDAYIPGQPGGTGHRFDWRLAVQAKTHGPIILAGGLAPDNVAEAIHTVQPWGVDVSSGVEATPGRKDPDKVRRFVKVVKKTSKSGDITMTQARSDGRERRRTKLDEPADSAMRNRGRSLPDERGYFGSYGGKFVPETLMPALEELEQAYQAAQTDPAFWRELDDLLRDYGGRPTPLYLAGRLSGHFGGARIYLKREDLTHTGAHKINNTLGQGLLARRMSKERLVAETGAGQHGVATATTAALLGMECVVYMGTQDMARQAPNVERMRLLGAQVHAVDAGGRTLKDAINEAIRDWVTNVRTTHYLLGSVLGPHPYPMLVRDFQSVIGREAREQILSAEGRLPDCLLACVGGGSNAIGLFYAFLDDAVEMVGVEAGGLGIEVGKHAARFADPRKGRVGVLHGTRSYVLQDDDGQILSTHSISAGLDYPSVGPEHSYLRDLNRVDYTYVTDQEALEAFQLLCRLEGIIPALESAHAVAKACHRAAHMGPDEVIIVNLSGRGDKDLDNVLRLMEAEG